MEREMEQIEHFSHKHPLLFSGEKKGDGEEILCNGCCQKISGASYSCKNCSFFLHKFCAKLPVEMKHLMHPEHPLRLLQRPTEAAKSGVILNLFPFDSLLSPPSRFPNLGCDACGKHSEAFTYHCSLCNFNLDTICASRALTIVHESHKHPLIPQLNPASFECYACGTKDEGVSYQCSTCRFWIHEDCASLPPTIKYSGHNHILTLLYDKDRPTWWLGCNVCFLKSGTEGWFYSCRGCKYNVHPKCILLTKKKERKLAVKVGDIDGSNSIHLPIRDESISLTDLFVKQICLEDNEGEPEINHFSHKHPLLFFNVPGDDDLCHGNEQYRLNDVNNDKICSGCDRIISASFYGCRPCNFFLHKWCAKLPDELKHQFHPHPLMLQKEIYEPGRKFFCYNCYTGCKGFSFQCVKPDCRVGDYSLDVKCDPLPGLEIICPSCFDLCNGFRFKYVYPGFQDGYCLDVKCASLPSSIVHEIHEHPLLLKKDCKKEGCAACQRRSWIASFGCATCNFSLHYKCALLPPTFRHRYDEHPFILNYGPIKDGPNEYICEFCEVEINPNYWFYHCIDCDQSACSECILKDGKYFEKSNWNHFLF